MHFHGIKKYRAEAGTAGQDAEFYSAMQQGGETMTSNPKLKDPLTDQLFKGIMLLDNEEECYQFFEDICTIGEIKALAQRLEVARMVKAGYIYDDIVAKTGASTATISRVKRCLLYGADGYKIVLSRFGACDPIVKKEKSKAVK